NHVDYDVFCKLRPVIQCQFHHMERRFGIFAVYVKDRHHQHLGYVGGIPGGTGVLRKCGKTDLVVDDQVQRPSSGIALQLGHVEGFGHNSLAREGRISMDQNGQHQSAVPVSELLLPGVRQSFEDRVNCFQVTRVIGEKDSQLLSVSQLQVGHVSPVVLYVSGPVKRLRIVMLFEFAEKMLIELIENVNLYIQPPPVRHSHKDFAAASARGMPHEGVQHGYDDLGSLQ